MPHIATVSDEVYGWAAGASQTGPGSGGMRTKLAAARIAQSFGCATVIASGHEDHPLARLGSEHVLSTVIKASGSPARAYKQWIAGTLLPAGNLHVDAGAVSALASGKSLLPVGVRSVDGSFERGVCLCVLGPDGGEVARGITSNGSATAGRTSSSIATTWC